MLIIEIKFLTANVGKVGFYSCLHSFWFFSFPTFSSHMYCDTVTKFATCDNEPIRGHLLVSGELLRNLSFDARAEAILDFMSGVLFVVSVISQVFTLT